VFGHKSLPHRLICTRIGGYSSYQPPGATDIDSESQIAYTVVGGKKNRTSAQNVYTPNHNMLYVSIYLTLHIDKCCQNVLHMWSREYDMFMLCRTLNSYYIFSLTGVVKICFIMLTICRECGVVSNLLTCHYCIVSESVNINFENDITCKKQCVITGQ